MQLQASVCPSECNLSKYEYFRHLKDMVKIEVRHTTEAQVLYEYDHQEYDRHEN